MGFRGRPDARTVCKDGALDASFDAPAISFSTVIVAILNAKLVQLLEYVEVACTFSNVAKTCSA